MTRAYLVASAAFLLVACGSTGSTGAISGSSSPTEPGALGSTSTTKPTLKPVPAAPKEQAKEVVIGAVQFMQDTDGGGKYGTVTVKLTNPNAGFWLPSSDFVFSAKDASGGILGTEEGTVSMAPSDIKDLTPTQISFGKGGVKVDKVEFQLRPKPWQPTTTYPTVSAVVSNVSFLKDTYFSKVTGEVTNTSASNQTLSIDCTLWDSSQSFAGEASAYVRDLAPGVKSPFSAMSLHSMPTAQTATCHAQPQDFALHG